MPGFELIDKKEFLEVKKIFDKNNGVLFAHGFEKLRKNKFNVRKFENKIAKQLNIKYVQCVSSGTSAIKIALKSIGIKQGMILLPKALILLQQLKQFMTVALNQ